MVESYSDSDDVEVDSDYSRIEQSRDWEEIAIDDGTLSLEKKSYHLRIFSRNDNVINTDVTSINFKQEVNAAQNPTFNVPPQNELTENKLAYLDGTVQLFIDGEVAFSGSIIKIDTSQTIGNDVSIKVRNPGRRLDDQSVDLTPDNSVYQDVLAKLVDNHNDIHSEYSDMLSNATLNNTTIVGDIVSVQDGQTSGTVRFENVNSDLSSLDRINVKVYTSPTVTVKIIPNGNSNLDAFSYQMDTLDKNMFGEWETIEIPSYPETSYDIEFELEGDSYLLDWIAIASRDVTREVTTPDVNTIGNDEFLYSRSGSDLQSNLIEDESKNAVYDSDIGGVRARQVAVLEDIGGSSFDDEAVNGNVQNLPTGASTTGIEMESKDEIVEGAFYIRAKADGDFDPDKSSIFWEATFDIGSRTIDTTIGIGNNEFEWAPVLFGLDSDTTKLCSATSSGETEEVNGEILPVNRDDNDDPFNVLVDVFYWGESSNSQYYNDPTFSNSIDDDTKQLELPVEYSKNAYATFTSLASEDNITDATTTANIGNTGNILGNWGPVQRVTKNINFPDVYPNSLTVSNSYPFVGVDHQVRVSLPVSGYDENNTPQRGYHSAELYDYEVTVSTNDLEILYNQDITGSRLQAISELADNSTYLYRWDGNKCKIFQRGQKKSNLSIRKENAENSVGIQDVYSSVEVYGNGGVYSGLIEADNPPDFVNRNKEIREADIESANDARRRAISFIRNNSTIEYEGSIDTMPTFAPVGELVDGSNFDHGQDMIIETVDYRKDRASISLGFKQQFAKKIRGLDRETSALTRSQTTQ